MLYIDKVNKKNELLEKTVGKVRNFILSGVMLHIYSIYYALSKIEFEKPVIAINTATYWHALRSNNINDQLKGFGSLMSEH